jgi:hypothetical protein
MLVTLTSRQWRVLFGAITLGIGTLLAAAPALQIEIPPLIALTLVVTNAVVGYLKAPPDLDDPAA